LLPGLTVVAWQIYLTLHFGAPPSGSAHGILGFPFSAWGDYFLSGMRGNHKLVGTGGGAYAESVSLLCFLGVLIVSFWMAAIVLIKRYSAVPLLVRWLAFTVITITLLYASFGATVMMHYTGYFKAIGVLFLLYPLLVKFADVSRNIRFVGLIVFVTALVLTSIYHLKARILPDYVIDKYTKMSLVTETKKIECFEKYEVKIELQSITLQNERDTFLSNIFGREKRADIVVLLKNTGEETLVSTKNSGSVHMSYQWLDVDGKIVKDGVRTAIPNTLHPGESTLVSLVTSYPTESGQLFLQLSPVQEGCAWFYNANPILKSSSRFQIESHSFKISD